MFSSLLARIPLVIIGLLPFAGNASVSMHLLILLLFFHYLFGSIAGPSWNSCMKDLVPENMPGTYFAKRSSYTQALNVVLAIILALLLDFVRSRHPDPEIEVYGMMFIIASVVGIIGALVLSFVQEPHSTMGHENIFQLFLQPLKEGNFQSLLSFNSIWNLAVNMVTHHFLQCL